MSNLAAVMKDEIRRLARKEVKAETATTKRWVAQHRKDITELKRQVRDLTREVALSLPKTTYSCLYKGLRLVAIATGVPSLSACSNCSSAS